MDKEIVKFILNWDRIFPTSNEEDTEPTEGYNRDDDFCVDLRYQTYESQLDLENDNVEEYDLFVYEDPNMVEIIGDGTYFKFKDEIYPGQVSIINGKLYPGLELPGKDEDVFDWGSSFFDPSISYLKSTEHETLEDLISDYKLILTSHGFDNFNSIPKN